MIGDPDELRIVELTVETKILGGLVRRFETLAWVWVDVARQWCVVDDSHRVRYTW